jgi:prepilin-type processing-associated H-X9-DG protein
VALAITPLFGGARDGSERAGCFNNLRQLGVAALKYVDDHEDNFPPRQMPAWPEQFRSHYGSISVLACPTDGPFPGTSIASTNVGDRAPRSYLLNGWSDYYNGVPPRNPFPASAIQEPAATIVFGEKMTESAHFWMDYLNTDDLFEVEQGRHLRSGPVPSGGSNFAFADGSVRFLRWGESFQPVNLWAVNPAFRQGNPNPF